MTARLRQSTAIEIKLGPFLDDTDGKTAETALTISQADVRLAKNDGDWAQKNESTTLVHEENGWYRCLLDTTDTNTLGTLIVAVHESGALPVWRVFEVVPAAVYDAFISGKYPTVRGVCTTGGSTTSIATSSLSPAAAVADQFKGRIVIFDPDTTTANLRGQATDITASTSGGTLTVTALTTAPASGDTFGIY